MYQIQMVLKTRSAKQTRSNTTLPPPTKPQPKKRAKRKSKVPRKKPEMFSYMPNQAEDAEKFLEKHKHKKGKKENMLYALEFLEPTPRNKKNYISKGGATTQGLDRIAQHVREHPKGSVKVAGVVAVKGRDTESFQYQGRQPVWQAEQLMFSKLGKDQVLPGRGKERLKLQSIENVQNAMRHGVKNAKRSEIPIRKSERKYTSTRGIPKQCLPYMNRVLGVSPTIIGLCNFAFKFSFQNISQL